MTRRRIPGAVDYQRLTAPLPHGAAQFSLPLPTSPPGRTPSRFEVGVGRAGPGGDLPPLPTRNESPLEGLK